MNTLARSLLAAALGAAMLALPASAQAPPTAPPAVTDWRAAARVDVLAAYDLYAANHPGMHDPANPGFTAQLARARDAALPLAERATDRRSYLAALGAFSAVLADGHALLFARPAGAPVPVYWTGFIAAWRDGRLLVNQAEPDALVAVGETILSCDGLAPAALLRERPPSRNFRPEEAGQWWVYAPFAFQTAAPPAERIRACRVRGMDGRARDVTLAWTAAPAGLNGRMRIAAEGEQPEIALSEPRPGIFHIGLPDFQPDAAGIAAYARLYEAARARRGELLRARAVVLDLRHNNGGSSDWSRDLAAILWGRPQVDRALADYFRGGEIWWRASPGNIAHMDEMAQGVRTAGREAEAQAIVATGAAMAAAARRSDPYHRVPIETAPPAGPPPPPSDFTAPVYVITPGGCASACLDAIDIFTRFANVRLIGAPTSADSTYMEVRVQDLPSGIGRIVIPIKLYVGRPRASGEVYRPHIVFADPGWTTAAFLDRIEAETARR